MAITINSGPSQYASIHEGLWHVVTSDKTGESSFKYVFDIYINGTQVIRYKSFPNPSTTKGWFDCTNIIRNYWQSYFKPNTTQTAFAYTGNDNFITYEIKFGEEYGGTTYLNLTSATYTAYNYYSPAFFTPTSPYLAGFVDKWLTHRDLNNLNVTFGEKLYVSFMNIGSTYNNALKMQVFTPSGASSIYTGAAISNNKYVLCDISPTALNTYFGTGYIDSTALYYEVWITNQSNFTDKIRVYLTCAPRYTPKVIHFLNSLGGYETFQFRMISRESRTSERVLFQRLPFEYDSATTSLKPYDSYKKMYAGTIPLSITQRPAIKLVSDFVNETDYNWLKELINSSEAYLEENGYYYPMNITTSNWTQKRNYADKNFNLELDLDYGRNIHSQYR